MSRGCDKVYIGKTKRALKTRIKEHLNDIKNKKPEKSGLSEHIITKNHKIDENSIL